MASRTSGGKLQRWLGVAGRKRFWSPFLLVVAVPVCEYFLFRYYLKYSLGIRVGFPLGLTDYDLLLPALAGLFVLIWTSKGEQTQPISLASFSRPVLAAHLVILATWLTLVLAFPHALSVVGHPIRFVWLSLSLLMFGSGLFLFMPPSAPFRSHRFGVLLAAFLVAGGNIVSKVALAPFWPVMNRVTGRVLCSAFSPLLNLSCSYEHATTRLVHPDMTVAVGIGCSGMEGIFFFLSLAFFTATVSWKRFRPRTWVWFVAVGVLAMYFANLLRVASFTVLAIALAKIYGPSAGEHWLLRIVHDFGGWAFYFLTLGVYFHLFFAPKRLPAVSSWSALFRGRLKPTEES